MKLTTIVLDDEKSACDVLESMITDYCPQLELNMVTQDPHEAMSFIENEKPDVLFIDINMPKMSGFEFLNQMTDFQGKIIFTTAYDQYAIQAFKYSAFDYLLKPIHVEQLEETIGRLITENKNSSEKSSIKDLLKNINSKTTISIPHNGNKVFISTEEIQFLEAYGNYTLIYTDDQKYTASKTLKEFELLLDESNFIRVHKSFIVNIHCVKKYDTKNSLNLVLNSGSFVPVSRRRKHLLSQFSV